MPDLNTETPPTFVPSLFYARPKAAMTWLEQAFGFETTMLVEDPAGDETNIHLEMTFGNGKLFVGGKWADWVHSPSDLGGANTQTVNVALEREIDAHCATARAAGATIVQEPTDQFYGARTYRALDLEGHVWTFSQPIRVMSIAEMEVAGGMKISTSR